MDLIYLKIWYLDVRNAIIRVAQLTGMSGKKDPRRKEFPISKKINKPKGNKTKQIKTRCIFFKFANFIYLKFLTTIILKAKQYDYKGKL